MLNYSYGSIVIDIFTCVFQRKIVHLNLFEVTLDGFTGLFFKSKAL